MGGNAPISLMAEYDDPLWPSVGGRPPRSTYLERPHEWSVEVPQTLPKRTKDHAKKLENTVLTSTMKIMKPQALPGCLRVPSATLHLGLARPNSVTLRVASKRAPSAPEGHRKASGFHVAWPLFGATMCSSSNEVQFI